MDHAIKIILIATVLTDLIYNVSIRPDGSSGPLQVNLMETRWDRHTTSICRVSRDVSKCSHPSLPDIDADVCVLTPRRAQLAKLRHVNVSAKYYAMLHNSKEWIKSNQPKHDVQNAVVKLKCNSVCVKEKIKMYFFCN